MKDLNITIAGAPKSGKTMMAMLIKGIVAGYNREIVVTIEDADGDPSKEHKELMMTRLTEFFSDSSMAIGIRTVQTKRELKTPKGFKHEPLIEPKTLPQLTYEVKERWWNNLTVIEQEAFREAFREADILQDDECCIEWAYRQQRKF